MSSLESTQVPNSHHVDGDVGGRGRVPAGKLLENQSSTSAQEHKALGVFALSGNGGSLLTAVMSKPT